MKEFGKVSSGFWISDDIQALSDQAKLLALYLLTTGHGNLIGIFRMPKGYMAADLGWEEPSVERAIAELTASGFLLASDQCKYICIPQFMEHNPVDNITQIDARLKLLVKLPQMLLEDLPGVIPVIERAVAKASDYKGSRQTEALLENARKMLGKCSAESRLENKRNREEENKRKKTYKTYVQSDDRTTPRTGEVPRSVGSTTGTTPETGEEPSSAGSTIGTTGQSGPITQKASEKPDDLSADFEQWWTAYPRREGKKGYKQKTFNKYRKLIRQEGFTSDQLLANLAAYHRYCDETGTTGTQYVMTTEPYLNNPDNLMNPWTVNHAARQRTADRPSVLDQFLEANAEHYAPEPATGYAPQGGGKCRRVQERERYHPEADCGPVWDHDRPVRGEVDTGARAGGSDGAMAGHPGRPASESAGVGHSPGEAGGERLATLGSGVSPAVPAETGGFRAATDGEGVAGSQ
ncbi:hypothetical protein [Salinisphaera sp. G21_0]|uniref:hypothetical protein n=1 Tax=Salinisphaera sp. G21_0 TaxID=2821094 RepID=UPI00336A4F15